METLLQDLRFGARMLLKNPAVTAIAVIALALGIGANSAIFSIVNAVLLRPLPFNDPDRLVFISETSQQVPNMSVSFPNFVDWATQNQVFDEMAIFRGQSFNLTGGDTPERIQGAQVSASLFTTLGVTPVYGRVFVDDEDRPGGNRVVLLSERLWQRRFGSAPDMVGKDLILNGESYTVVGILPAEFQFPSPLTEMWASLGRVTDQPGMNTRGNHPGIYSVGRLKQGTSLDQARAEMNTIASRLEQEYPDTNKGNGILVSMLYDQVVQNIRPALLVLLGAVGFVLLIACANVANLLLARAASRQKEISIRTALGAGRLRIVRQLLTESVLLSLVGGGLGLLLAYWGVGLLISASPPGIPRLNDAGIDLQVLGFAVGVSVLTGIVFGLAPAFQASKTDLNETLKEGGRSGASASRHRLRSGLVIFEVAVSLVLLIGAGLMIKSFLRLQQESPGFDPANVLSMQISLPVTKYTNEQQRRAFSQQLLERVETLPGVHSAGVINPLPMGGGGWQTGFVVEGLPAPGPGEVPSTDIARISADYFDVMRIRLLKGRYFTRQDTETAPRVAIVDETFANRYWPEEDPLGKRIKLGGPQSTEPWLTIVGVVNHVKNYGVDQDSRVETYIPYVQSPTTGLTLMVRADGDPTALTSAVRSRIKEVDSDLPIYNVNTMEQLLANSVAPRRLSMFLLTVFAAVALLLAAVGIYGVMSYSVTQRTHEIGVRMALGAQKGHILKQVVGHGLRLTAIGLAIGLAASFLVTGLMSSLLFGVKATDPLTFAGIPLVLAVVALVATYIPARRATKVDPMVALRYE